MAGNSNIRDRAKLLWIRGMKSVSNTASNIANNTKYKVDEMTLQNRRRELAGDLSSVTYTLWLKGAELPDELTKILEEIQTLDEKLNDMRAEKYAQGRTAAQAEEENQTADVPALPEETTDTAPEQTEDEPANAEETPQAPAIEPAGAASETQTAETKTFNAVYISQYSAEDEAAEEEDSGEDFSEAITAATQAVKAEINDVFDHGSSVDKMAEKVNNSLNQLTDRIRSFSPEKNDESGE